jgi:hypothetical protein
MRLAKLRVASRFFTCVMFSFAVLFPIDSMSKSRRTHHHFDSYSVMPSQITPPGEKLIIVNPNVHAWGAYSADGELIRSGMATAGNNWCADIRRGCRTKAGSFRIYSLGSRGCKSRKFPVGRGGAPMPYCMFFNGGQALHGSYQVVAANVSHGCVRLHVEDAEWLRFNFVDGPSAGNGYRGTRLIVKPY